MLKPSKTAILSITIPFLLPAFFLLILASIYLNLRFNISGPSKLFVLDNHNIVELYPILFLFFMHKKR